MHAVFILTTQSFPFFHSPRGGCQACYLLVGVGIGNIALLGAGLAFHREVRGGLADLEVGLGVGIHVEVGPLRHLRTQLHPLSQKVPKRRVMEMCVEGMLLALGLRRGAFISPRDPAKLPGDKEGYTQQNDPTESHDHRQ